MQKKQVLVVAVHPDDETLGAGGTLLKHQKLGDDIHCVFCTTMSKKFAKEKIFKREQELSIVCDMYSFKSVHFLGLETTKVDEYSKAFLVSEFSKIFQKIQPNVLYLPFAYDVHSDHRIIFETAFSCTKSFRYPSIESVLMMETLSESEFAPALVSQSFIPNVFVDISEFFEKKCKIMQNYESELQGLPFPRSLENMRALATYRACAMGGDLTNEKPLYAESFMLLKQRW